MLVKLVKNPMLTDRIYVVIKGDDEISSLNSKTLLVKLISLHEAGGQK